MMTQTAALFLDAFRELNHKKMFWITLVISCVVVAAFAIVGINARGITVLWYEFPSLFNTKLIPKAMFYKFLFSNLGVAWWLNWLGIILALVSTAGIIPDFIAGGSVDLYLSKPISRLRLFLTKYLAGLSFVALQIGFFTVACFLLIGVRAGSWDWKVFLAIPLTLLVFSYLFSVCALLGLLTRSTVASMLLTVLFWLMIFGIETASAVLLMGKLAGKIETEAYARQFEFSDAEIARYEKQLNGVDGKPTPSIETNLAAARKHRRDLEEKKRLSDPTRQSIAGAYSILSGARAILPKTGETGTLLGRWLNLNLDDVQEERIERRDRRRMARGWFSGFQDRTEVRMDDAEVVQEAKEIAQSRTAATIIGSSLIFEGVILALACWVFSRRDY